MTPLGSTQMLLLEEESRSAKCLSVAHIYPCMHTAVLLAMRTGFHMCLNDVLS